MRSSAFFAAIAALICTVLGAAMPAPFVQGLSTAGSSPSAIVDAVSSVFAYQLVGAASDKFDLLDLCWNGIRKQHYTDSWATMGLNATIIESIVCLESGAYVLQPSAYVTTRISPYASQLFAAQLLAGFSSETTFAMLCNGISTSALDQFGIDHLVVMQAVCGAADMVVPDANNFNSEVNKTAVAQYSKAASALYAIELLAAANTADRLAQFCAVAPKHIDRLDAIGLDGHAVQQIICTAEPPVLMNDAVSAATAWYTQLFIIVLKALPNEYLLGYRSFICGRIHVDGLDKVGIDGNYVKKAFSC